MNSKNKERIELHSAPLSSYSQVQIRPAHELLVSTFTTTRGSAPPTCEGMIAATWKLPSDSLFPNHLRNCTTHLPSGRARKLAASPDSRRTQAQSCFCRTSAFLRVAIYYPSRTKANVQFLKLVISSFLEHSEILPLLILTYHCCYDVRIVEAVLTSQIVVEVTCK